MIPKFLEKKEYKPGQFSPFHIHHINYDKELIIPENCCTLCQRCNAEVNKNRQHWTKFFQSLLTEKYGYQYTEKGFPILNLKINYHG